MRPFIKLLTSGGIGDSNTFYHSIWSGCQKIKLNKIKLNIFFFKFCYIPTNKRTVNNIID